jgi:hypothetical protein
MNEPFDACFDGCAAEIFRAFYIDDVRVMTARAARTGFSGEMINMVATCQSFVKYSNVA